jgi:hypothetical protein
MNDNTTDTKLTDNIGQIDTTGMSCFGGLQERRYKKAKQLHKKVQKLNNKQNG